MKCTAWEVKIFLAQHQCSGSGSTGSTCFWASWIRILLSLRKIVRKTLISTVLWLPFDFLSLKNDVEVPSKSTMQKNFLKQIRILLASWRSMLKIEGSGSGSISQRRGSPDLDPHQNVMDPEHCATLKRRGSWVISVYLWLSVMVAWFRLKRVTVSCRQPMERQKRPSLVRPIFFIVPVFFVQNLSFFFSRRI